MTPGTYLRTECSHINRGLQPVIPVVVSLEAVLSLFCCVLLQPGSESHRTRLHRLIHSFLLDSPQTSRIQYANTLRVEKQTCLARSLETLTIDMRCIPDTRVHDSGFAIRLTFPSIFWVRLSGEPETAACFFWRYCGSLGVLGLHCLSGSELTAGCVQ